MDFIIDRTAEDVMYAQSFIGASWNKLSNEEKEKWLKGLTTPLDSLKGFFNYTDMIRIKNNYNTLVDMYNYTGDLITTSYTMDTIPNRTTMSDDFSKIWLFAIYFLPYFVSASFQDYRTINGLSSSVNKMDYNYLNNYEHLLKNLYDYKTNRELELECEFIGADSYELDGYIKGFPNDDIEIKIPSGYIAIREIGTYSDDTFTPAVSTTWQTNGNVVTQRLSGVNSYANLKIKSGIQDVVGGGRNNDDRNVDVEYFTKISFNDEPIEIDYPATSYTATTLQSDYVSINNKEYAWFSNASDTSGRIIITLYDENQDVLEEYEIKENTLIRFNGASYFTIDSEVGDSIDYSFQSSVTQSWNCFGIANGTSRYLGQIHSGVSFDVSNYENINISRSVLEVNNDAVIFLTKSFEGGQDISQLDVNDIKLKYVD